MTAEQTATKAIRREAENGKKIHNWLVDRPGEVSSEKNCCSNWCFWIKWKHVFKGQLLYCFKSCVIQLISCCKKLICRLNCSEIREWETWFQICWRLHDYSSSIFNNYSPKWRWLVVDIYRAAKRRGKYPTLATDTEVNSCFSIY